MARTCELPVLHRHGRASRQPRHQRFQTLWAHLTPGELCRHAFASSETWASAALTGMARDQHAMLGTVAVSSSVTHTHPAHEGRWLQRMT